MDAGMIIKGNKFNGKTDVMFKKPSANASGGKNVGFAMLPQKNP